MRPPVPSRAFFAQVSTKHGPYIVSCLPTKSQRLPKIPNRTLPLSSTCPRFLGPRIHRQYSTASAQSQSSKPYLLFRRIVGFTAIAIVAFSTGLAYQTQKTVARMMAASMPTDEETLTAFVPSDEFTKEVEDYIHNHPVTLALRQNPAYTESRPHLKIPQELRARHLTAGILATPGGIVVPPYVFCEEGGKSLTAIFYLGSDVSGHPGIVHGGLLATLLDESMARCCFPALPNKVGVTANLNIDYRRPAIANNYAVLKAKTVKVEGRKAWVEAHIETLPEDGKEPAVLVEAKALFVEPKQAAAMASLYKITN